MAHRTFRTQFGNSPASTSATELLPLPSGFHPFILYFGVVKYYGNRCDMASEHNILALSLGALSSHRLFYLPAL